MDAKVMYTDFCNKKDQTILFCFVSKSSTKLIEAITNIKRLFVSFTK